MTNERLSALKHKGYITNEEYNELKQLREQTEREDNMTKEQKDKLFTLLAEDRNNYVRDCNRRIAEENGKITGADYMLQRFLDVLRTEVEPQESEDKE